MATFIRLSSAESELLRRNRDQVQSNRLQKVEADEQAATGQQLQATVAEQQTLEQPGGRRQLRFRRDQPAASRLLSGRGVLGTLMSDLAFTPDDTSTPSPVFASNRIQTGDVIRFARGTSGKYGVIRIGSISRCLLQGGQSDIFLGRQTELLTFVQQGGVLWINNEYEGCGIPSGALTTYIRNLFGCQIGFNADEISGIREATIAFQPKSSKFPPIFHLSAACSITGGTPMYVYNGKTYCAYEQVGNGYLVLSGDSNGTAQWPDSFGEFSLYPTGVSFIEALREL
jgi:hypothetical protein